MAVFNIFKKKKPEKKAVEPVEKIEGIKEEKPKVDELRSSPPFANARVKEAVLEVKPRKIKEKKMGIAYRILKAPQITEKATALAEKNQYVFKVYPETNKIEIKKAIEDLYNVDISSVRIIKVRPKRRRLGRISGWRAGYKKAIVKIKAGQKIEVMPR